MSARRSGGKRTNSEQSIKSGVFDPSAHHAALHESGIVNAGPCDG
jgi:hypothetical protein